MPMLLKNTHACLSQPHNNCLVTLLCLGICYIFIFYFASIRSLLRGFNFCFKLLIIYYEEYINAGCENAIQRNPKPLKWSIFSSCKESAKLYLNEANGISDKWLRWGCSAVYTMSLNRCFVLNYFLFQLISEVCLENCHQTWKEDSFFIKWTDERKKWLCSCHADSSGQN